MALTVTAAQIRAVGGWSTDEAPDADLTAGNQANLGRDWVYQACGGSSGYDGAATDIQNLLHGAAVQFACHLFAIGPGGRALTEHRAGPLAGKEKGQGDFLATAKALLKTAGFTVPAETVGGEFRTVLPQEVYEEAYVQQWDEDLSRSFGRVVTGEFE